MSLDRELHASQNSINTLKRFDNRIANSTIGEPDRASFVLAESVERMKEQISKLDLENAELRRRTLKLDKKNRILKDNVVSLLQEKERLQDLEKTVEVLNNTITFLQRKINENESEISGLKKMRSNEKLGNLLNAKLSGTSVDHCKNRHIFQDPHLLARQVELLSTKNLELRKELERRAKISDKAKIDHEAVLRDRTELMMEIRYLKSRVDDMKSRLDRSVNYFLRRSKPPKHPAHAAEDHDTKAAENSLKGSKTEINLTQRKKSDSNARIILNSFESMSPKSAKSKSSSTKASCDGDTSPVAPLNNDWNSNVLLAPKDFHERGIESYVADIKNKIENECKQNVSPSDTAYPFDILEAIAENTS